MKSQLMSLVSVLFILSALGFTYQNESKMDQAKLDVLVLKNQYALNVKLFNNVIKDISGDDAKVPINKEVNSIQWIAGHTLDIQHNLAALLSVSTENPYAESFGFGKPFVEDANYPSLAQMKMDWNALAPRIQKAMEEISVEKLNEKSPFPIPYNEQTIRGLLAFQMHHLGYEIGQLGLYRKYVGLEAMSYM